MRRARRRSLLPPPPRPPPSLAENCVCGIKKYMDSNTVSEVFRTTNGNEALQVLGWCPGWWRGWD